MKDLDLFGPDAKFHHVGLAVSKIDSAELKEIEVTKDLTQGVKVSFVSVGGATIELIEPIDEKSPVSNSIKKGMRLVHLCYEVDDIETGLSRAISNKFKVISKATPAPAFNNRRIVWVYHHIWGLFELLERESPDGNY